MENIDDKESERLGTDYYLCKVRSQSGSVIKELLSIPACELSNQILITIIKLPEYNQSSQGNIISSYSVNIHEKLLEQLQPILGDVFG